MKEGKTNAKMAGEDLKCSWNGMSAILLLNRRAGDEVDKKKVIVS